MVLDVTGPSLAVTISVNHPDVPQHPVDALLWRDGEPVFAVTLRDLAPVTAVIPIPPGQRRIVLETAASRVVRPRDLGLDDDRELGLMVGWTFVENHERH